MGDNEIFKPIGEQTSSNNMIIFSPLGMSFGSSKVGGATYNDITVILLQCSGFFIFEVHQSEIHEIIIQHSFNPIFYKLFK